MAHKHHPNFHWGVFGAADAGYEALVSRFVKKMVVQRATHRREMRLLSRVARCTMPDREFALRNTLRAWLS